MRTCIYCRNEKTIDKFSLEHIIPQFLGGAQAPDFLKTRDVCRDCNSNLGLFVDAAFEKDFMVYSQLSEVAYSLFDPNSDVGLPLRCMGTMDIVLPEMKSDEVCEYWLGPLGEQIFWVRPHDEQKYWYTGGNPRTVKKVRSRAYFIFSENSQKAFPISWFAFKDAFSGKKVTKILCSKVEGPDPSSIGFASRTELDEKRVKYLLDQCSNSQVRKSQVSLYFDFDVRFLAKLALGIAYTYFGESAIKGESAEELYKALWLKPDGEKPRIKGSGMHSQKDTFLKEQCGVGFGTTISLIPFRDNIALNLNINRKLNWVISCSETKSLSNEMLRNLGLGKCFVLIKPKAKVIELSLEELLMFNDGVAQNTELTEVRNSLDKYSDVLEKLKK
ncbi:hypothetical protein A1L58_08700 [Shewanella baltica]|uniref:HNH endonuclease n=1 Tax=Shewanella baltica TaxID=62322 RepID=UPI0007B4A137|nr:HNH endonuclease [Shewanella baltica]KZK65224.1 hypothetical protein A1L58_08700 [Shewanella baltica]